jgi:hypothetical protein
LRERDEEEEKLNIQSANEEFEKKKREKQIFM